MKEIVASAPGKAILLGEHAVNRQQPAIATALDPRAYCRIATRTNRSYTFRSGRETDFQTREHILEFKVQVDGMRSKEALDDIRALARSDFFAPARFVLAHIIVQSDLPGLDIEWRSDIPMGSGLGSGAAHAAALALAALHRAGCTPSREDLAWLAWQGDVIAHGGVASGLDSGASAFGGVTRYTSAGGPKAIAVPNPPCLVVGDTLVRANTAEVNTRVLTWLAAHPAGIHLFTDIGLLVEGALAALERGDMQTLGHLMNENQLILEKLGVSSPEIETLVEAAIAAGALGAKLSGSGGGGIVVALVQPERRDGVAKAIERAGGRALLPIAAATGVRLEPESAWTNLMDHAVSVEL